MNSMCLKQTRTGTLSKLWKLAYKLYDDNIILEFGELSGFIFSCLFINDMTTINKSLKHYFFWHYLILVGIVFIIYFRFLNTLKTAVCWTLPHGKTVLKVNSKFKMNINSTVIQLIKIKQRGLNRIEQLNYSCKELNLRYLWRQNNLYCFIHNF